MPLSTVSAVLLREGLGKRSRLTPLEPANRYERRRPGELMHSTSRSWAGSSFPATRSPATAASARRGPDRHNHKRGTAGWEFVHVAIDDHSRLAYAEVLSDERASTAVGFLRRARAFFARHGIRVQRVMTDNGSAYRAHQHRIACRQLGLKHLFTRPYRPRTNGKAERFIKTLTERLGPRPGSTPTAPSAPAALDAWLYHYNFIPTTRQPQPQAARLTPDQGAWELHLGDLAHELQCLGRREPAPGLDRVGSGSPTTSS